VILGAARVARACAARPKLAYVTVIPSAVQAVILSAVQAVILSAAKDLHVPLKERSADPSLTLRMTAYRSG
jgi:hypothetical protein